MWPFGPMSSKAPGVPCGVRSCQCDRTQNLPGRQDVRSDAYPQRTLSFCFSVSRCPLLMFISPIPFSFSLCCLNQASHLSGELNASIQTLGLFMGYLTTIFFFLVSRPGPRFLSHVVPHVPVTGHWLTGTDA